MLVDWVRLLEIEVGALLSDYRPMLGGWRLDLDTATLLLEGFYFLGYLGEKA